MSARHARQQRLREVGPEGQARIASGRFVIPGDGLRAEVAARYAAGAGVGCLVGDTDGPAARAARAVDASVRIEAVSLSGALGAGTAETFGIVDPMCLAVARGAFDALEAVRRLLGGDDAPR